MADLLKTFFSKEVENRIDEYLLKMKSMKFLSELNLDLKSNYISLKSYSINDLENLKSIWLDVANLSAYLYVEYEFFRQFSFPNRYESQIYEDCLKKLGYKRHNGIWKIDQIPNKQCIIENIFYSYFYMFLCQEKKNELDNERFMNENARNSMILKNLCNPSRNNDINGNYAIIEEITYENIDQVVLPINGEMRKSNEATDLCVYCDSKIINGNCQICGGESIYLETILQKTNKVEDRPEQMRTNSSQTSSNSKIKSSHWICNVCSYNQNNNSSSTNCEVCLSSKFAKINSRAFESSSSEVSNENRIEHNANNADNKDKWTCTKCTFINKISVDLCEICLAPNINKIGTMNDNKLPEEIWCCKRCGENNSFECYKCKNCRVPAEFLNKWRCGQCSYYNDKIAIRCGACEIGNPYLIKCNICAENLVNEKYDKICKECTILCEKCTNRETIDYQNNKETQSTTSEFINLLPRITKKSQSKGDRNSEKLIENQMKSNEDIQQNLENKDKIKKKNAKFKKTKINPKPCKNCKAKVCVNNQYWCTNCENFQWYCQNEACDGINFQNDYCKQCTAKKDSDFSACNNFLVMKDDKEVQMWQCGFCLQFIAGTLMKCNKCKNLRDLPNYKKCKCNWNNLTVREKCDKCSADLIQIIKL